MITGDWRFFWIETLKNFSIFPQAWDSSLNTGIGKPAFDSLWICQYLAFTSFLSRINIPWDTIGLMFWILPSIISACVSSYYLYKTFVSKTHYALISSMIYGINTYSILLLSGGQLGVSLAYGFSPLVFLSFYTLINSSSSFSFSLSRNAGVLLAILMFFDIRMAGVMLASIFFYWIIGTPTFKSFFYVFVIPLVLSLGIHSFWILPFIVYGQTTVEQLGSVYTSVAAVKFFSFADFSHAFSLLHPNWPDNIFGKTYFLEPEFLFLPLLAYTFFFFIQKKTYLERRTVLFFACIGLIGAFLSKGTNEPFGSLYIWIYSHIPFFTMFRDPTKFYILIAFSYAALIPYSLSHIENILSVRFHKKLFRIIIPLCFLCFWMYLVHAPLYILAKKILTPVQIPSEYQQLKVFLSNQSGYFRTLWIPEWQRFGFFSDVHPAIGRHEVFREASSSGQIAMLENDSTYKQLKRLSVKYIIVPFDSEKEIFIDDHMYTQQLHDRTITALSMLPNFKKVPQFNELAVYEISGSNDHLWIDGNSSSISYRRHSSTFYEIETIDQYNNQTLIFSEKYDPNWVLRSGQRIVKSIRTYDALNSFVIPENFERKIFLWYKPQYLVTIGSYISVSIVFLCLLEIVYRRWRIVRRRNI